MPEIGPTKLASQEFGTACCIFSVNNGRNKIHSDSTTRETPVEVETEQMSVDLDKKDLVWKGNTQYGVDTKGFILAMAASL